MEKWKEIPGYESMYEASNKGRIRNAKTGMILKLQKNTHGYYHAALYKNGKRSTKLTALIVWETFNGPIPEGMQVNHINEDKTDNRLENLNLMSPKENSNWGTRNKRLAKSLTNGKTSKPVVQYTVAGEMIKEWCSVHEIERQTGWASSHIAACCRGKKETAYGSRWGYKK